MVGVRHLQGRAFLLDEVLAPRYDWLYAKSLRVFRRHWGRLGDRRLVAAIDRIALIGVIAVVGVVSQRLLLLCGVRVQILVTPVSLEIVRACSPVPNEGALEAVLDRVDPSVARQVRRGRARVDQIHLGLSLLARIFKLLRVVRLRRLQGPKRVLFSMVRLMGSCLDLDSLRLGFVPLAATCSLFFSCFGSLLSLELREGDVLADGDTEAIPKSDRPNRLSLEPCHVSRQEFRDEISVAKLAIKVRAP